MSDVLTPEEVDALLKGVSSGDVASNTGFGVPTGEVRELDLANPEWINRNRIPPLDFNNQVLARELTASIRPLLKNEAEVAADPTALQPYADYIAGLPRPTCIHQTSVTPLDSDVLFVISSDLILNYVDFYYGGDGVYQGQEALTRDFTVTELRVADRLQKKAARHMTTAWEAVAPLTIENAGLETNPEFANFFNSADVVTVSRFNVNLGEKALGWLDIVISKAALDPFHRVLEVTSQGDQLQKQSRWAAAFEARVRNTGIELNTTLSTTTVNLGELIKLRVGDIVPFELPPTVELTAGAVPLFRGTFGVSNGHNAIRITERLR